MGWRFRKSVTLLKGVKVNISKRGLSLTVGGRGHSLTFSKYGIYANASIPGTGIAYREKIAGGTTKQRKSSSSTRGYKAPSYRPSSDGRSLSSGSNQGSVSSSASAAASPKSLADWKTIRAVAEDVAQSETTSVLYVQQRLQTRYEKAAYIMARLERMRIVSKANDNGERTVLLRTGDALAALLDVYESNECLLRLDEQHCMPMADEGKVSKAAFGQANNGHRDSCDEDGSFIMDLFNPDKRACQIASAIILLLMFICFILYFRSLIK